MKEQKKYKILYVITALNVGGAEMMLYRMLCRLDRERFEPVVVSLMDRGAVGEMIETDLGIKVETLGIEGIVNLAAAIYTLGRIFRAHRPDLVHAHMVHANLLSRVTRIFSSLPLLICTIHNIEERGSKKSARYRLLLYRLTDFLSDLTTQVSAAGLEKYRALGAVSRKKSMHLPNGIDPGFFKIDRGQAAVMRKKMKLGGKFVFLAAGSLTAQKDYPNLLRAFALVKKKHPEAALLIAGRGPLEGELHRYGEELIAGEGISWLGFRRDIAVLMDLADCYVMSSAWEGLPIVLLEAAASGLPVIATDVGGNREVVLDKKSGFLVPPGDHGALASAMDRLMAMPESARRQLGSEGKQHARDNYSIEKITRKWQDIYTGMIRDRKWSG